MKVIKRDGHMVEYSPEKIENAILKANKDVDESERVSSVQIRNIIKYIEGLGKKRILVEDIQDIIEIKLMSIGKFALAKKYITYRYTRELVRKSNTTDVAIKNLISDNNDYLVDKDNSKNTKLVTVQREYLASITSTDITRRFLLSEDIVKAHDEGILYFHNMDYFAQNALCNSSSINLDDMLQNGCTINGIAIGRPCGFKEAVDITVRIIDSVMVSQYGKMIMNLSHLAPFVVDSYKKYLKKYQARGISNELSSEYATEDLKDEISYGIKNLIYGVNTLTVGNVSSVNLFMYLGDCNQYKQELALLIEEILKQNIRGVKKDIEILNSFPTFKLIYVLERDNLQESSKYYYLTKLAMDCVFKEVNLNFVSEKVMLDFNSNDKCLPCINECMLLPTILDNSIRKRYGCFNQGVVTLNLADISLSSDKDIDVFWKILDERLELCHRALQIRHKRLSTVTAGSAPVLWQYGAVSRLCKNDDIHDLLHSKYSTLSLGFAGLYECVKTMKGKSFYEDAGCESFALKILEKMNSKCKQWSDLENITYTLCGTSNEIVSNKFASCLKERFGVIKEITDKEYIVDSYYVPAGIKLEFYHKLSVESKMQKLISGGLRICLEINNNEKEDRLKDALNYLYENILCVQIGIRKDVCFRCGYVGMLKKTADLNWQCPNCNNQDKNKLKCQRIYFDDEEKEVVG